LCRHRLFLSSTSSCEAQPEVQVLQGHATLPPGCPSRGDYTALMVVMERSSSLSSSINWC
jgi:hypothetical protein